jgi:chromate transporter
MSSLALSQSLPGPYVTNLAVQLGHELKGVPGAVTALAGLLLAPFFVIIGMAASYEHIASLSGVQGAMTGLSAVATGLVLRTGWQGGRRAFREGRPALIFVTTFYLIAVLDWQRLR